MSDFIHQIRALFAHYRTSETTILLIMATVVGMSTGFGALVFSLLVDHATEFFFGYSKTILVGITPFGWKLWIPIIPAVGGLLVGPIVYKYAQEAKGHGVPEVMSAVALKGGIIRPRVAFAKAVASAISLGSGGSAGREGPIVQIGSSIGSTIGQVFKMSEARVRVLVGCGAAAGISAIFNAPIAGVMFSLEIVLGDFALKTFSPVVISSVLASFVTHTFIGNYPAFEVPAYHLVSVWEIPLYVVLGIICGVVAYSFTWSLYKTEDFFDNLKIQGWVKPAIGGLLLGCVGFFFPQAFGGGYEAIQAALEGKMVLWLLIVLIFAKIMATNFTLGSGASGGIFAPSLFMGAAAGGAFGDIVHRIFPQVTATPGAYALVGMAAVVAGTTHAPMTGFLIIFEMTRDYRIILPLMVACVFGTLVARKIDSNSIYTWKLVRQGIHLIRGRDVNVLARHTVSEVMRREFESIPMYLTLHEIFHRMETGSQTDFPVVDGDGHLVGTLSFQDIRRLLTSQEADMLIIASDIATTDSLTVQPDDTLAAAMDKFGLRDLDFVPVVEPGLNGRLVGILRRRDLTAYYNRQLIENYPAG
jgi:CIC family chloride channel protein